MNNKYKEWICGIDTNNQTIFTRPSKNSIYRGETVAQEFALLDTDYSDISVSYLQSGQTRVLKTLNDLTVAGEKILFDLTPNDTLTFTESTPVICQVEVTKNDGSVLKSRHLLSYVLPSSKVQQYGYIAYAFAIGGDLSVVQIGNIYNNKQQILLTVDNTYNDFKVYFKDEYNSEIIANCTETSHNKYSVEIPQEVLEKPGKIYLLIKSDSTASGYSNALRVSITPRGIS